MPAYQELRVGWLEEPFPAHDQYSYDMCARFATVPLAAGENHYTRYEFEPLLNSRTVAFVQPDLSKTGGLSESMRIAAMASAKRISVNPHTSATAINMSNSIHFLCAVDNAGYFEADVTTLNPFRDQLSAVRPYELDDQGCVQPAAGKGIGLELDLDFIARHPLIDGPCYV
jgi:L-alanine-DL-glutamate epimerase-like enolase superfamily enzyme